MQSKKIKFIDLFCGMGGFRIAFEKYQCECVFSSDIDKYACETYKLNFHEEPKGDITTISSSEIPDFDILCAGFPCQPFSIAGKRLGFEDTRGTLFFEVARIINDKRPKAFFLENVKGIVNHNGGETLEVIINTLIGMNYYVEWKVLNAKDYGVPQNRERWYCVGFDKKITKIVGGFGFNWPNKKKLGYNLSNIITTCNDKEYKISEICMKNIQHNIEKKNLMINDFTLAYEIRPSRCQFSKKLISPCLTAKMGTGGNNIPVVVKQGRKLTEKECLMIMGYPSDYNIHKNYHTYKQIGNSVVVPILEQISCEIVEKLKEA